MRRRRKQKLITVAALICACLLVITQFVSFSSAYFTDVQAALGSGLAGSSIITVTNQQITNSRQTYGTSMSRLTNGQVYQFQYTVTNRGKSAVKLSNQLDIAWDSSTNLPETGHIYLYPASMSDASIESDITSNNAANAYISNSTSDMTTFTTQSGEVRTGFQVNLENFINPVYLDSSQILGEHTALSGGKNNYTYNFKLAFVAADSSADYNLLEGQNLKLEVDTSANVLNPNTTWVNTQHSTFMFNNAKVDTFSPIFNDTKPNDIYYRNGSAYNPLSGITAYDNCTGDVTSRITYTGTVDITTDGTYTINYTVTDINGNTAAHSRTVQVEGVPLWLNGNTLLPGPGIYSNPITLMQNSVLSYPVSPNPAYGTYTVGGAMSGAYTLTTNGTTNDLMILTGNNTYTGTTTINNKVQVGNGGTTGSLGTGAITNNGILDYNRSDNFTVPNAISGSGSILKEGIGALTLSGNNSSFSGGITISNGSLYGTNANSFGKGTITLGDSNTGSNNISMLRSGGGTATENIVVSSNGTGTVTIGTNGGPNMNENGNLTINHDVIINDSTGDRTTYQGIISGSGNITITGNRVTFGNNADNFTGSVTISSGSIYQNNSPTAIPAGCDVIVNGTYVLLGGTNAQAGTISGTGLIQIQAVGGTSTFTIGGGNKNATFNGTIGGGNTLILVKNGTGTQTLTGNNAYSGGTTINGGALVGTSTTAFGTGTVTVNNGGTVNPQASISNTVTVNAGGNFNLTNTISTGNLTFSANNSNFNLIADGSGNIGSVTAPTIAAPNGFAVNIPNPLSSSYNTQTHVVIMTGTSSANYSGAYIGTNSLGLPSRLFIEENNLVLSPSGWSPLADIYNSMVGNITTNVSSPYAGATNYSITSGSLPPGLTMDANGNITGSTNAVSSDTPYTFTVYANDNSGGHSQTYTWNVLAPRVAFISSTQNWKLPMGGTTSPAKIHVVAVGGGGGTVTNYGNGGNGGQVVEQDLTISPTTSYALTIGAGGAGGGSNGGATSFASLVTAAGGYGKTTTGGPYGGGVGGLNNGQAGSNTNPNGQNGVAVTDTIIKAYVANQYNIPLTAVTFGAGGGSASWYPRGGNGGTFGGGAGASTAGGTGQTMTNGGTMISQSNGKNNTGGGGGGAGAYVGGQAGGSGVIYVKY